MKTSTGVRTFFKHPNEVVSGDVLVGSSGGLSVVYGNYKPSLLMGHWVIQTEHGSLYVRDGRRVEVMDLEQLDELLGTD